MYSAGFFFLFYSVFIDHNIPNYISNCKALQE